MGAAGAAVFVEDGGGMRAKPLVNMNSGIKNETVGVTERRSYCATCGSAENICHVPVSHLPHDRRVNALVRGEATVAFCANCAAGFTASAGSAVLKCYET